MPEQTKAQRDARIAALKRERDGYLQDGRKERAAEVDDELDRLDAGDDKPKGRSAPKKQTTAQAAPAKVATSKKAADKAD